MNNLTTKQLNRTSLASKWTYSVIVLGFVKMFKR